MREALEVLAKVFGRGRVTRWFFNVSPMYRRSGGRLVEVTDDLKYIKIKIPLNYKTRNYVGTLYGGHMYSCVDGIYMVQLVNLLGKDYIVWDKAATIRFKRPGKETLYAEFKIEDEFLDKVKRELDMKGEKDYTLRVDLVNGDGKVCAEVDKVLYFAKRDHYKEKLERRKAA